MKLLKCKSLRALGMIALTGCSFFSPAPPPPANCWCPIAVHASDNVKAELKAKVPNPSPELNQYEADIGRQQKDIDKNCGIPGK